MKIIKLILLFLNVFLTFAQENRIQVKVAVIAFYNLENLFDTINDPQTNDDDFTPEGLYRWSSARYEEKKHNMAKVISQIGKNHFNQHPVIIGLCEAENVLVLEDLIRSPQLKSCNYNIVHYNSPDRRGIDVAILYDSRLFKVFYSKAYNLYVPDKPDFYTRNQVLMGGILDGDTLYVIVNHWPSRRGGQKETNPLRIAAAKLTRHIVDSILNLNENARIIVMGDLNDDPVNESITNYLRAKGQIHKLENRDLYNPSCELYKKGIGTLAYQGKWNFFDQIIISQGLLNTNLQSWEFYKAYVFNEDFLINKEGKYKGYPYRTFSGNSYIGGYSDHLPSYIILMKRHSSK